MIVFALNPLHNLVHIAIGAVWLGAAAKHGTAKSVNMIIGIAYGLVTILGFAGVLEFLAITSGGADNYLHLVSAALSLYFGSAGAEGGSRTAAA